VYEYINALEVDNMDKNELDILKWFGEHCKTENLTKTEQNKLKPLIFI